MRYFKWASDFEKIPKWNIAQNHLGITDLNHCRNDKGVHTIPKSISLEVNKTEQLDIELVYFVAAVQDSIRNTFEILLNSNNAYKVYYVSRTRKPCT